MRQSKNRAEALRHLNKQHKTKKNSVKKQIFSAFSETNPREQPQ